VSSIPPLQIKVVIFSVRQTDHVTFEICPPCHWLCGNDCIRDTTALFDQLLFILCLLWLIWILCFV